MTAWIRALVLVAAIAVLASCGGGASTKLGDSLAKDEGLSAGGSALGNSGPKGVQIHFVEDSLFGTGITFHNTSRTPVTVIAAIVEVRHQSIVRQVGTTLLSWNPRPCPPHIMGCLLSIFFRSPSATARPGPVVVKPGKGLAVQLDFRLGRCSELPFASFAPVSQVDIAYRSGGRALQQAFDLGSSTLRLEKPPETICRPRPFSRLAVDGTFAGSTASTIRSGRDGLCSRTSIGSLLCDDSDRCSRAGAVVSFRSGLFQNGDSKPAERIDIRLSGYHGAGRYLVGNGAEVTNVVGIGEHGWTNYQAYAGSVTVDRVTKGTLVGHMQATLVGFRKQRFHAAGTWACTV